jgi:hypothetical protein
MHRDLSNQQYPAAELLGDRIRHALVFSEATTRALRDALELVELDRYYRDPACRASMPCSECGKVGGCKHFPAEGGTDV